MVEKKKNNKEQKKKRIIIAAVVSAVIIFLIISNFIVVNNCAPGPCWGKMKVGEFEVCEGPSVCTKRTLFDVITNGLFHGRWE